MQAVLVRVLKCTLIVVVGIIARPSYASDGELSIPSLHSIDGTRLHELHSEQTGFDYHVLVLLPDSYGESESVTYPTMYLLDGGASFPMLAGYYRYLLFEEVVPAMIIVALSYGSDDWQSGNHRGTDYTAPTDQREHWGGAESFQRALRTEVLPLIENNYRSDPGRRMIFGQSLGGQFVLYTALTEPGLFWGHISSNPALHRNLEFYLQPWKSSREQASFLFVASGSDDSDRFRGPALKWISHWSLQDNTPWQLKAITIEGYGHFSLAPESFRVGLAWLFQDR